MPRAATPSPQVPMILWGSFIVSQLTIAGVGWFVVTENPPAGGLPQEVLWVLAGVGCALPIIAPLVSRMVGASASEAARDAEAGAFLAAVFPSIIVGFALREAGAICAFVILILFADPIWWAVPASVAFASLLISAPTPARIEAMRPAGPQRRRLG